jgi:branched-chain amino acid transport system substrate-binding protein
MRHLRVSAVALTLGLTIALFYHVAAFADELRIGTTLSLTGPYGQFGRQALHGIELAIEEINAKGGVQGRRVKLFVEDFGTLNLKQAGIAAQKLIAVDKVELFLPLIVEDAEVVLPHTSRANIFSMVVGCGARTCGTTLGKYNVRAASSHDEIIRKLVTHATSQKMKRACIIAAESTYFEPYGKLIQDMVQQAGVEVVYQTVPLSNSEDFRDVALQFKRERCDAIFAWIPIGASGAFHKRVRQLGSTATIYGIVESDDPGILSVAGDASEGIIFATFSAGSLEFQKRFQARFHESVSRPAVPAYDGVKLLLTLVEKVGTSPAALLKEFSSVRDFPAENGSMTYSSDGERIGEEVQLKVIQGGVAVQIAE